MNDLTGTENVDMEAVSSLVVFKGIAFKINQQINLLIEARNVAVKFESGLNTKAAINKEALALRDVLITSKKATHGMYTDVLTIKHNLLSSVAEVQKADLKVKLEKEAAEIAAKLAAM